jgi:hypothetical protein
LSKLAASLSIKMADTCGSGRMIETVFELIKAAGGYQCKRTELGQAAVSF